MKDGKTVIEMLTWDKVFQNGPSKICGRQPLKHLKRYGLPKQDLSNGQHLYEKCHSSTAVFQTFC